MKIYWLTMDGRKCFFTPSKERTEHERDFRADKNNYKFMPSLFDDSIVWGVEEEDVPDESFGYCINGLPWEPAPARVLPDKPDCSVGIVRKIRRGVSNDDGTCATCPYYTKEKPEGI